MHRACRDTSKGIWDVMSTALVAPQYTDTMRDLTALYSNFSTAVRKGIVALQDFAQWRCDTYGKVGYICTQDLDCLGGYCRVS